MSSAYPFAHMDSTRFAMAHQLQTDNADVIAAWSKAIRVEEIDPVDSNLKFPGLNVQCGDEVKRASVGDYVIKHDDGTFDVRSAITFARDYVRTR